MSVEALVAKVAPNQVFVDLQVFVLLYLGVYVEVVVQIPKTAQGC